MAKYSDDIATWLSDSGYSTCFFVAGGNIMHLIESFSKKFRMIPVVHEVAATIAADYFNEASSQDSFKLGKALALVTAGPGVTNVVTGVAGAFIDSRELLVIGGQVKSNDLKNQNERQRGIQEIDGIRTLSHITKSSILLDRRMGEACFKQLLAYSGAPRKGPVYVEICLDIQGSASSFKEDLRNFEDMNLDFSPEEEDLCDLLQIDIVKILSKSDRPVILIGGGFPRSRNDLIEGIKELGIPLATTWHGADRIESNFSNYAGRPNMFGQRWANVIIQQSDLIIVLGSTLGLQQTGYNLDLFAPYAHILQIDIDAAAFKDDQLKNLIPVKSSIESFLRYLGNNAAELRVNKAEDWKLWSDFVQFVRGKLPLVEKVTDFSDVYVNPFRFIEKLSDIAPENLNFVPCSSGGSYTASMQVFEQKKGNLILSSRGLGSMGVGLSGAIGAAIANDNLTWLIEGDGGILQNIQELAILSLRKLPIKVIIFGNNGYASIRGTQKKYFGGNYVGCDRETGLGLPDFEALSSAFGLRYIEFSSNDDFCRLENDLLSKEPMMIYVAVSPDQPFFPKIDSRLALDGSMESNPLHMMSPALEGELNSQVIRFL
jgi:acetolactate synthase I/II/III large subunit